MARVLAMRLRGALPAAWLLVLRCIVQDGLAFPTQYALNQANLPRLIHHQRGLEYHSNGVKALAGTQPASPDQIVVTLLFKSIARWPDEGETENWITIPLGKWLDSENVPSVPPNPISAAIISVRSPSPLRVACQAKLAVGDEDDTEKKSVILEWVPGVVSVRSKDTFPNETKLLGVGCH